MPPKPKNTREEIVSAAVNIIRRCGLEGLTAKKIGEELKSSPSSIFTHFNTMEEIQQEAIAAIRVIYDGYVRRGLSLTPPFKGYAMESIRFAGEEPRLFAVLFMRRGEEMPLEEFIGAEGHEEVILSAVKNTFGLNDEDAAWLYHNLWLYAHGIAALTATGACSFTREEISRKLSVACYAFLQAMHSDEIADVLPAEAQPADQPIPAYVTGK
ncbi:MAG: TetR family transcriptional regulator [Clostridia bacterium]|nr:TetR family transcriptional regulator [Clostridia bacterium]